MVQNLSLSQIADIIGVSITTAWQNRQKVCMALQEAFGLQDKFIDIAECDEYYMTVSFKGKETLLSSFIRWAVCHGIT